MVESLQGKQVREIACGTGHSAAITTNGELYTWGQGDHGRLGHGDTTNQPKPKQVYIYTYELLVLLVATIERERKYCIAGNFCLEKIFIFFAPQLLWANFFCPV